MTTTTPIASALEPWIQPVPGALPVGPDPRPLPAYQSVREEIAKLESPGAGPCRWELVERDAGAVLVASKDLASAAYLAGALAQLRGVEGLALGTTLLGELLVRFEGVHPARPRARANALGWFLDRAEQQALATQAAARDRAHLASLETAIGALRAAANERLAGEAPSTHRLAEAVQRLVLSLPPEAAAPVAAPERAAASAPAPAPAPAPASVPVPAPSSTTAAPVTPLPDLPQDVGRVPQFLAQLGTALCTTSTALRSARPHDPEALRLLLAGLYLPVIQAPVPARERRIGLPGPASALRGDVERLRRERDGARLLEVLPRALEKHRFWLDLHLALHEALTSLGPSGDDARALHANELRSLVARLPSLLELELSDGTPCASGETRAWLQSLAGAPGASSNDATESPLDVALRASRELLRDGKTSDALTRAHAAARAATTGRERFVARLEVAALALDAKVPGVALAITAELHREATARDLAEWDAPLAARVCALYLRAAASERSPAALPVPHAEVYARLCLLDPAAAVGVART